MTATCLSLALAAAVASPQMPNPKQAAVEFWGDRLKLGPKEIARFTIVPGMMPVSRNLVVRKDGTVVRTIQERGKAAKIVTWRLKPAEFKRLRTAIETTDFARLRRLPARDYPNSAVDGADSLYVVRQKRGVTWWSNGHWTQPQRPVALFGLLEGLAG